RERRRARREPEVPINGPGRLDSLGYPDHRDGRSRYRRTCGRPRPACGLPGPDRIPGEARGGPGPPRDPRECAAPPLPTRCESFAVGPCLRRTRGGGGRAALGSARRGAKAPLADAAWGEVTLTTWAALAPSRPSRGTPGTWSCDTPMPPPRRGCRRGTLSS